jgi:hypothetical protein
MLEKRLSDCKSLRLAEGLGMERQMTITELVELFLVKPYEHGEANGYRHYLNPNLDKVAEESGDESGQKVLQAAKVLEHRGLIKPVYVQHVLARARSGCQESTGMGERLLQERTGVCSTLLPPKTHLWSGGMRRQNLGLCEEASS